MERRAITITGIVQGVGFRPFVFRLASQLALAGSVRNLNGSVVIEVEGPAAALDDFTAQLRTHAPVLARIEHISASTITPRGEKNFSIKHSAASDEVEIFVSPDIATCHDCLRELFDPADRRFRYPFINCTNCGPRLTIVTGAPYDRSKTTMASFQMCDACRSEYENPLDRRFHAQPIACPQCGPRLQLLDQDGRVFGSGEVVADFAAAILNGQIGGLKGLGGFHVVCDATHDEAVRRLRERKYREEKPFAIMFRDVATVAAYCEISSPEEQLLISPAAPIVLLARKSQIRNRKCVISSLVAPNNRTLGVMLPYTPLHHLLIHAVDGRPLVMTSGNRSDEPIARDNDEALEQLRDIADLFAVHNRLIYVRCDDSVTRIADECELPIRRSRGYAPQPLSLPFELASPILAVGGQLKGTFALGRERHAFVSHHLGDLDHHRAFLAFERDIALYQEVFRFEPLFIAHDLHPDYASTHFAQKTSLPLIPVQHHHAHMASCMAENGLTSACIGVSFDGLGFGTDGHIWGGEFLVGEYADFRRVAHLRYAPMPGGDQATREPWRMAVAHFRDAQVECREFKSRIPADEFRVVEQMLERRFNCPLTSSIGRLFDAIASIAGVRDRVSHEGQAAMELEWLADDVEEDGSYKFDIEDFAVPLVIDTRPLIRAAVADVQARVETTVIARRFHNTVARMISCVCDRIRQQTSLDRVVLSGGVFMNALLTTQASELLQSDGFTVYRHRLVPPNDGGLSLGQLAVAGARVRTRINAPRVR